MANIYISSPFEPMLSKKDLLGDQIQRDIHSKILFAKDFVPVVIVIMIVMWSVSIDPKYLDPASKEVV